MSPPATLLPVISVLVFCGLGQAADRQLPGRIIRVVDGDTLILDVRGSQYRIELAGVDAPELNQPWGSTAANQLYSSLTGVFVVINQAQPATDGSTMGTVIFKDRDIALDLLHGGLAWSTVGAVTLQPGDAHPYAVAQARARLARRGLWSEDNPVPPWEWRTPRPGVAD